MARCSLCLREAVALDQRWDLRLCAGCTDGGAEEALASRGIGVERTRTMHIVQAGTELHTVWRLALTLTLPRPIPLEVVFRRESYTDRVLRVLRIRREIETGARGFDAAVWVQAEEDAPLLRHPGVQIAVLALLHARIDEVTLSGDTVTVHCDRPAGRTAHFLPREDTPFELDLREPEWALPTAALAVHVLAALEEPQDPRAATSG